MNNTEEIQLADCKDFINQHFVSKLLDFLRKSATKVTNNAVYMKVYQLIIYQCDTNDNNEQIYSIFEEFVREYLDREVKPLINRAQGEDLLTSLV